jgi:hypothetical protein
MEIARERFLDDTRTYHLSLAIRSRTSAAHSLLSALTDEERAQVSAAIVKALDEVERIARRHVPGTSAPEHPST